MFRFKPIPTINATSNLYCYQSRVRLIYIYTCVCRVFAWTVSLPFIHSLIRLSVSNNALFRSIVLALAAMARKYIQTICYVLYYSFAFFCSLQRSISRPFPFYGFSFLFIGLIIFGFNMVASRQKKTPNNTRITTKLKNRTHKQTVKSWSKGVGGPQKVSDIPRIPIRIGEKMDCSNVKFWF